MMKKLAVALVAIQVLTLATPTAVQARPRSAMDRAIAQCAGAVIGGAILGAIIGNNTGGGHGGRGAAIGGALGAVACAVIMANNSRENRERIARAEEVALNDDQDREEEFRDEQGRRHTVKVDVEPTADPTPPRNAEPRICRMRQTTLGLNGDETRLDAERVCRNPETHAWEVVA
jgi:outer membrane lipoprotein SlyB